MFDSSKAAYLLALPILLWQPANALGNVGGSIEPFIHCGSSRALYTNASSTRVNFELFASNANATGGCAETLTWTDADGVVQTVSLPPAANVSVSSSLAPEEPITWTSTGSTKQYVSLSWQLERAPAQSISGQIASSLCASSGVVFTNLTSGTVNLDFAAASGSNIGCSLTFSWIDAVGQSRMLNLGSKGSQGVSTSLPAGGFISWTSTVSTSYLTASWQIERVDLSQLW